MKLLIILCVWSIVIFAILMIASLVNYIQKKKLLGTDSDLELVSAEAIQYQELMRANEILEGLRDSYLKQGTEADAALGDDRDGYAYDRINTYSGNMYLDAVLTVKESLCQEKSIRLDLNIARLEPGFPMEDMDLVRLAQNILDNAVEAAEKLGGAFISFVLENVKCKGSRVLHITATNSKLRSEKPLDRKLATSKEDKSEHGFGTQIIKELVERYKGTVNFTDLGERFKVDIVVPYE